MWGVKFVWAVLRRKELKAAVTEPKLPPSTQSTKRSMPSAKPFSSDILSKTDKGSHLIQQTQLEGVFKKHPIQVTHILNTGLFSFHLVTLPPLQINGPSNEGQCDFCSFSHASQKQLKVASKELDINFHSGRLKIQQVLGNWKNIICNIFYHLTSTAMSWIFMEVYHRMKHQDWIQNEFRTQIILNIRCVKYSFFNLCFVF